MIRFPLFALATLFVAVPAGAASSVAGRWITNDGKALVEIGRCGQAVCGRIVRVLVPGDGTVVDRRNPDPKLRGRKLEGLTVLFDFIDAGKEWRGKIYSPEEGKTYKSFMSLNADGTLTVKGCIAFFCRTLAWKKAS